MRLTFVQLGGFAAEWRRLRLTDEDLVALEQQLLAGPDSGAVMSGTGGLRKVRFAPSSRHTGKRGAMRVAYIHVRETQTILLMSLFAKADQANLSAADKARLRAVIDALRRRG